MSEVKIKLQGDLDTLCGVYSVFNTGLLLIGKNLSNKEEEKLYNAIIDHVPDGFSFFLLKNGTSCEMMADMLKGLEKHLHKKYNIKIKVDRPFENKDDILPFEVLDQMKFMCENNSYFVFALGPPYNHWTVLKKITDTHIHVHDKKEWKPHPKNEVILNKEKNKKELYNLYTKEIFRIQLK